MRLMARHTTFAHRLVLKNKGARLLAVALGALFIQAGHAQTAGRLLDLTTMRVMTLDTMHVPFRDRMMFWQPELHLNIEMTVVTRLRIPPRIEDECRTIPRRLDVPAPGTMTSLATCSSRLVTRRGVNPKMNIALERPRIIRVAIVTLLITHEGRSGNLWNDDDGALNRAAGGEDKNDRRDHDAKGGNRHPGLT